MVRLSGELELLGVEWTTAGMGSVLMVGISGGWILLMAPGRLDESDTSSSDDVLASSAAEKKSSECDSLRLALDRSCVGDS